MLSPSKFILGVHGTPSSVLTCTSPVAIPASATTPYDFTAAQSTYGLISSVQALYIDNSGAASGQLTITCTATGQVIKFPAQSQGYINVLQPNPFVLSIVNAGTKIATMSLLNFSVPQIIWPATI